LYLFTVTYGVTVLEIYSTVAKFATLQKEGEREVKRDIEYYNLDVIISVGYRVKSQKGVKFRQCATSILKKYYMLLMVKKSLIRDLKNLKKN
jgi:hypothetical protein